MAALPKQTIAASTHDDEVPVDVRQRVAIAAIDSGSAGRFLTGTATECMLRSVQRDRLTSQELMNCTLLDDMGTLQRTIRGA